VGGGGNGVAASSLTVVAFGCTDVAVKSFPFNVTPMLARHIRSASTPYIDCLVTRLADDRSFCERDRENVGLEPVQEKAWIFKEFFKGF